MQHWVKEVAREDRRPDAQFMQLCQTIPYTVLQDTLMVWKCKANTGKEECAVRGRR